MKRYKRQFLFLLCLCTFSAVIGTEALADMKTVPADRGRGNRCQAESGAGSKLHEAVRLRFSDSGNL